MRLDVTGRRHLQGATPDFRAPCPCITGVARSATRPPARVLARPCATSAGSARPRPDERATSRAPLAHRRYQDRLRHRGCFHESRGTLATARGWDPPQAT